MKEKRRGIENPLKKIIVEMWVDRMDNITQPKRRKLSALALLSLLPSDNTAWSPFSHALLTLEKRKVNVCDVCLQPTLVTFGCLILLLN
uniref:Importin-7/11-like TPR repeats domain-containing protein n=1 Tax=Oryctolagus cuniculus TaxID=9986 RepID=G1U5F8_RABIT